MEFHFDHLEILTYNKKFIELVDGSLFPVSMQSGSVGHWSLLVRVINDKEPAHWYLGN